jgi:superfamily I DNA/RNA helicase
MDIASVPGLITRVERIWLLRPFKKALDKRRRETVLLAQLGECIEQLLRDPRHPGLNLEALHNAGRHQVLSARLTQACRVILVPLTRTEIGLLYFDSDHDAAYHWVDRNRSRLGTMLAKDEELIRGIPITAYAGATPVIQRDEESPIALVRAEQFRSMVEQGIERYLTHLDREQRWLIDLNVRGLLLVKGGAGTGKTAVAIHRLKALAERPVLPGVGPERVLYLCYNVLLARVVTQLLAALYQGAPPETIEVKTFHTWCHEFLQHTGAALPTPDETACQQAVFKAFGRLAPERRAALAGFDGYFVDDEIEQVIKHNGLVAREQYLVFERKGRGTSIKRAAREAIWEVHERAREYEAARGICRYCDLPLHALQALEALSEQGEHPQYRAIVIDEGQDCSPVMIRLARRLLADANGPLTVFADPAQGIYECGFQWTQRELRPAGGNVKWLKKVYRTTREIFELARPLIEETEELREDLAQLEPPERHGPRPHLIVARDEAELRAELVGRIRREAASRPANQIGVLGSNWAALQDLAAALREQDVPVAPPERGAIRLSEPTVKLMTMQSVKGLDFPAVFVIGPRTKDLGGPRRAGLPETRRTLYVALTRSSEHLTIGAVNANHHPLLDLLDDRHYEAEGSCARSFVNLRGVELDSAGNIVLG